MLLFVLVLAFAGLLLVGVGLRGRRVGEGPHCRRCRYNLVGQPGLSAAARCPECGTPLAAENIRQGLHQRRGRMLAAGCIMFLLGAAGTTGVILSQRGTFNWVEYVPARVLLWQLDGTLPGVNQDTWVELARRHAAGDLAQAAITAFAEACIAEHANAPPVPIEDQSTRARLNVALTTLSAMHASAELTGEQIRRIADNSLDYCLVHREPLVVGYRYGLEFSLCATAPPGMLSIDGAMIAIHANDTLIWDTEDLYVRQHEPYGPGELSFDRGYQSFYWVPGESGATAITLTVRYVVRDVPSNDLLLDEDRTFVSHCEVLAKEPPGYVPLSLDEALGQAHAESFRVSTAVVSPMEDTEPAAKRMTVAVHPSSGRDTNFARGYTIQIRSDNELHTVRGINLGPRVHWSSPLRVRWPRIGREPESLDVVLRANRRYAVANPAYDSMWGGVLVFHDVPVVYAEREPDEWTCDISDPNIYTPDEWDSIVSSQGWIVTGARLGIDETTPTDWEKWHWDRAPKREDNKPPVVRPFRNRRPQ